MTPQDGPTRFGAVHYSARFWLPKCPSRVNYGLSEPTAATSAFRGKAEEISAKADIGLECRTSALARCARKRLARFWRVTRLFPATNRCVTLSDAIPDFNNISYLALTTSLGKGGVGGSIPPRGTRFFDEIITSRGAQNGVGGRLARWWRVPGWPEKSSI